jgi:Ca2+-binding EF-hand superfamily protein
MTLLAHLQLRFVSPATALRLSVGFFFFTGSQYKNSTNTRGSAHSTAAMAMGEELKSEIDEVFRMFDEDDSGNIDAGELASALFTITGEHIPRDEALAIMQKYDRDHNGSIDRGEFEGMVLERMKGRSFDDEMNRAFKLLEDTEMPGFVTRESVRRVAQDAGEKLSEAELSEMFDVIVTGQQAAAVDFPTFCSIQSAAEHGDAK